MRHPLTNIRTNTYDAIKKAQLNPASFGQASMLHAGNGLLISAAQLQVHRRQAEHHVRRHDVAARQEADADCVGDEGMLRQRMELVQFRIAAFHVVRRFRSDIKHALDREVETPKKSVPPIMPSSV